SNSKIASSVTHSSNVAATCTPRTFSAINTRYAPIAACFGSRPGNWTCKYAPIASAIAGGANTNSTSDAIPARKPPAGPNGWCAYANGAPECGRDVVTNV